MLLNYEDESIYGPGKNGPAMQQIVAKHMAFNRELGAVRIGGEKRNILMRGDKPSSRVPGQ
jgi:hypothetical protein